MKKHVKLSVLTAVLPGVGGLLIVLFTARAAMPALTQSQWPRISQKETKETKAPNTPLPEKPVVSFSPMPLNAPTAKNGSLASSTPGMLDERRQFALGMIETGNHDGEIGGAGEVSRYQIMPSVWRRYSDSRDYHDPGVSLEVAREHWVALYTMFKRQAHREPTDFDMYVLWNTRSGYYATRAFDPTRLGPVVRDRAQRYVNLVQWGQNS